MQPPSKPAIESIAQHIPEAIGEKNGVPVGPQPDAVWDKAVDETLAAARSQIHNHLAGIREDWNQRLPINSLPTEVLAEVFKRFLPLDPHFAEPFFSDSPETRRFDALITLALVCRRWHHLVMGTPSLWTSIKIHDSEHRVKFLLQRSRSHPIEVSCCHYGDLTAPRKQEMAAFAQQVNHHAGRFRVLFLRVPVSVLPEFWISLQSPSPLLERLHVAVNEEDEEPMPTLPPIDLFSGCDSHLLKELSIDTVPCLWTCTSFESLELLYLDTPAISPTLRQVLSILGSCCKTLKDLRISNRDVLDDPSLRNAVPIDFPALRCLHLWVAPPVAECICRHIGRIPACQYLIFQTTVDTTDQSSVLRACFRHLLPDIGRILSRTKPSAPEKTGALLIDYDPNYFSAGSLHAALSVEVWSDGLAEQSLRDIVDIIKNTGVKIPIVLGVIADEVDLDTAFWELMNPLPGLNRISVLGDSELSGHAMRSLATYLGQLQPKTFRNLKYLELRSLQLPLDCIAEMVERRYANEEDLEPMTLALHCNNVDESAVGQMRRILGSNKVMKNLRYATNGA